MSISKNTKLFISGFSVVVIMLLALILLTIRTNKDITLSPTGSVVMGTIVPFALSATNLEGSGWLLCDGSEIDPKYQSLRTALGSNNTPNLQGLTLIGSGDSYKLGGTGGAETHTLIEGEMPSHGHHYSYKDPTGGGGFYDGHSMGPSTVNSTTGSTGGGKAHNNMQPYQVVNYIIYTGQDN